MAGCDGDAAALHAAGIPIVAGTDQSIPGYSLHRELELYVDAGFTPLEALQAATIVPHARWAWRMNPAPSSRETWRCAATRRRSAG